jgi:aerobic carbon-monoxide dehydrogenase medium subunit
LITNDEEKFPNEKDPSSTGDACAMISPFTLHQPESVEAACSLLAEYGQEAKILAGGSELILLMKAGLASLGHLIDIKAIRGLDRIHFDSESGTLHVGALVTHRALELSPVVREHFPLVVEMESHIANVRVKNVGSLAGNLSFAEPRADPGTLLLAYGAKVRTRSASGERTIEISDYFVDYYKTALNEDEIITEIEIPKLGESFSGTYVRFCPGERPSAAVALLLEWGDGSCQSLRLVMGCVGPRPIRGQDFEEGFKGKSTQEILAKAEQAAEQAALVCDPMQDFWGGVDYKRQVVKSLILRALFGLCKGRMAAEEIHS